jgi:hypothetical protein
MWGLWLALDCLDNEFVDAAHSKLSPLQARLRGLGGRVCFRARKAADLGPDDGVQRGRISFEVVGRLIQSQVKERTT